MSTAQGSKSATTRVTQVRIPVTACVLVDVEPDEYGISWEARVGAQAFEAHDREAAVKMAKEWIVQHFQAKDVRM